MLKLLADSHGGDFAELAAEAPDLSVHLTNYGLVAEAPEPTISIAAIRDYLRGQKSRSQQTDESEDWLDILANIGRLRNKLEARLRRFVKRQLQSHLGTNRWIEVVAKHHKESGKLTGISADDILNSSYLADIVQLIWAEWGKYFQQLEKVPKQHRVTREEFKVLLDYVNSFRPDAHAGPASPGDRTAVALACARINKALDRFLED